MFTSRGNITAQRDANSHVHGSTSLRELSDTGNTGGHRSPVTSYRLSLCAYWVTEPRTV
jgi:hypothetical protein